MKPLLVGRQCFLGFSSPKEHSSTESCELDSLFHGLSLCDKKPVVLSLVSPYSDRFVPKHAQVTFPAVLCDMFSDGLNK